MASIIRIKRSSGTNKPASLNWGELGYVTGIGSYGGLNQYKDRVFLGDDGNNVNPIGGYYYASMMEHSPGEIAGVTNTRNSDGGIVVILDSSRKVDQWNVDNLRLDGNTFSSQNTDGDIVLDPNGTGEINIVDDTYLSFGNNKDVKLRYDELTDNRFEIEGADWNFANNVAIRIDDTTASTTPTTGALTVTGGVGFATDLNVGGNVDIDLDLNVDGGDITTNLTAFNLLNANATTVNFAGASTTINIGGNSGTLTVGNPTVVGTQATQNLYNTVATTVNAFGDASTIGIGSTSATLTLRPSTVVGVNETQNLYNTVATNLNFAGSATALVIGSPSGIATIRNATLDLDGDLNIDGGDVTSNTAALNLFNTNVTTANVLGAATAIGIGSITGTVTINNPTVVGTQATQNLYNTVATTVNAFGAGTAIGIGATTGIITINNPTVVGTQETQNLYNTVATTVNAFGDASTIGIGSISATLTLRPSTVVGVNATQNLYNTVATNLNFAGAATALVIGDTTGITTIRNATVDLDGDLNIDGGDVTSNTAALNLFNTNVTTANVLGSATVLVIGATTGTATINNPTVVGTQATQNLYNTVATTVNAFGAGTAIGIGSTSAILTLRPSTVLGVNETQNLYNTVATTVNAFGDASTIGIGSTSATLTLRPSTVVGVNTIQNLYNTTATTVNAFGSAAEIGIGSITGTVTINNPTVVGTQATQNLYNTVATNLNFAGAATALDIGATTGIATIRNASLSVPNATTLTLGATSSATSVTFPSTPNTSFVAIAATTNATTTTSGALRVAGGVGIASDVYIGGILNVTGGQTGTNLTLTGNLEVEGNTTLGNTSGDVVTITGSVNHTGPFTNVGGVTIDNVGISSNVISSRSGGGNVLYIDPYPDGLSNEGLVVVKGNLQVDGTTTTVDSSNVTVNGSIISLGDVTSNRTVVATVASGVSTITLDSVVGINTGDIISGNAALPNSGLTTITAYDTATKIVTITGTTSSGITSTTQLIVTHAYDTNTDRGIAFSYNTGVGTANQKTGFFGYDDSTGHFTYVPDAGISNSVVSGTKGTLDIGALYLNFATSGISTRGSAYFDENGKLISTNTPEVGTASTSNFILTTDASNVPVWTDTLDGGTF